LDIQQGLADVRRRTALPAGAGEQDAGSAGAAGYATLSSTGRSATVAAIVTPEDVGNRQFSTTRLRPGYDEREVDAFLDEAEAELDKLRQENRELESKLAETRRSAPGAQAALSAHDAPADDEAAGDRYPATGIRALAQHVADQAIAAARRDAAETIAHARRRAEEILQTATRQAGQAVSEATARAESLERDARERHRQAIGSLGPLREELESRVDYLRAFEREYRGTLKAYLASAIQR
jgi:DivIVA domain-containing protein